MVARIFLLREKLFFLFKKACRACLARMSHVRLLFDEKSLSFVRWNTIKEGIKATMEQSRSRVSIKHEKNYTKDQQGFFEFIQQLHSII